MIDQDRKTLDGVECCNPDGLVQRTVEAIKAALEYEAGVHRTYLEAMERAGVYRGRYHVLHGAISPVDGVGPERLHIGELLARVAERCQSAQAPREPGQQATFFRDLFDRGQFFYHTLFFLP